MNANNWPPVVQPGQPQLIPLTPDMIVVLLLYSWTWS